MKAIVNTAPDRLEWQDLPTPEPGPGQVRVRTVACGVCATDLAMVRGWERTAFPAIPGHEWSGVVEAAGAGVDPALVGQPCVAENVLDDGGEVGFEHPGGYAFRLITQADRLQVLPPDLPLDLAAVIEPLAVCVRGLRRLRLEDRRRALVFGDGPMGLLLVMLLVERGVAEITLVGGRDHRLAVGRELGKVRTLHCERLGPDLAAGVAAAAGRDYAAVIEASGSPAAAAAAIGLAAAGGKVLFIGDYADACACFRWNTLLHRELEIIGSNASAGAWPEAVRLAGQRRLPLERLVTQRLAACRFSEAFDRVRRGEGVKTVLLWDV